MKRIIIETSISIENNEVYNIVANNVKLYKSNDYSLLKCFEGNRVGCLEQLESDNFTNIEKRTFVTRVNKLRAVMRERGFDKNFPILVVKIKGVLYIVDGQGRFTACQLENIPFYYTILEGDFFTISDAISYAMRMNCLQTPWRSSDKYRAACVMYNKPRLLEILTEYNKNYGISNNSILMALFNQSACKSEHFNPKRIENEEITEDKVNFLDKICLIREKAYQTIFELSNSLTKSKKVKNEKYVKSFTNILRKYPNLNTEKFVKNLALLWLGKEMYKNTYKTSAMTEMLENIALIS